MRNGGSPEYLLDVRGAEPVGGIVAFNEALRLPLPPLTDIRPEGGVMCIGCAFTPLAETCPTCPRESVRAYREQLARPLLPDSRWRRLLTVFQRKAA